MADDKEKTDQTAGGSAIEGKPPPEAAAAAAPPISGADDDIIDFNPDDVDRILAEEDPKFAEELKEIQAAEFKTDVAIASVDIEAFLKEGETIKTKQVEVSKVSLRERIVNAYERGHARISKVIDDFQNGSLFAAKTLGRLSLSILRGIFKYSLGAIGKLFSYLIHLPGRVKLLAVSVLLLLGASGFSIYISFRGHFLPQMGREYLNGFAEHADEIFEYSSSERKESFESAIRHPEHMYEFEKVVVNLRDPAQGERLPMGLFEFYIEMNSQDATVEMSERKTEAKHIIERVIEQLTYEELVSQNGKNKLKFIVRKELNDFLSKTHHVKQVYIKTFVLKP